MKSYSACGVKPIRITLYPKVLNSVFINDTATNTAISVSKPQWIDVAYPNVKHFGLKLFCPQLAGTGNSQFLRIIATWDYRDWETDRKSTRLNSSHRL